MNYAAYDQAVWLKLCLCLAATARKICQLTAGKMKTFQAMKATGFILLITCLQVSANGSAQVTFSGDNVHIEKVFEAIKKQTEVGTFDPFLELFPHLPPKKCFGRTPKQAKVGNRVPDL